MSKDQKELMDVVVDYTYALDTLDDYDYQRLCIRNTTKKEMFHAKARSIKPLEGTNFILVWRKKHPCCCIW